MPQNKNVKKEDIVYSDSDPVSIVRVANGFKIIPSMEPWAYHPDKQNQAIPSAEYVFNELEDVFEFLTTHFEDNA